MDVIVDLSVVGWQKLEDVQSTGNGLLGQEACADLPGRFPPRILEI